MHSYNRSAFSNARSRAVKAAAGAVGLAAGACGAAGQAPPAPPSGMVVSSVLERIVANVDADDRLTLEVAAGTVASHADQLIVSVQFTNQSGHIVDGVRVTSPVPPDVAYVADSATGSGSHVLFSVDQGRTFGQPSELTVVGADGAPRAATPADYTHVRFILDAALDVGASGIVRFRAVPR
ncbi:MAG TPA: hypothetical protein VIQ99_04995 [Gammaproteobacteria bacterium]